MPRESTRRTPRLTLLEGGSTFEIQERGSVLRVALLGVLDRERLQALRRRVAPLLVQRGRRIVLDGHSLRHVDYRVAADLRHWNEQLKSYGHALLLAGWSPYLRTLLTLGDTPVAAPPASVPTPRRVRRP